MLYVVHVQYTLVFGWYFYFYLILSMIILGALLINKIIPLMLVGI